MIKVMRSVFSQVISGNRYYCGNAMNAIQTEKAALRKEIKKRLANLTEEEKRIQSEDVTRQVRNDFV